MSKNVSDLVLETIKPLFKGEITLVDVEYAKKADGMHLIIYIDKENGVTVDDCVEVSRLLDQPLEDLNPTNDEPYFLDVSSYGLDKPLKFDWQFKKYLDKKVNVKLYAKQNGKKDFVATLKAKTEDEVVVNIDEENVTFKLSDVAYITPYIEF